MIVIVTTPHLRYVHMTQDESKENWTRFADWWDGAGFPIVGRNAIVCCDDHLSRFVGWCDAVLHQRPKAVLLGDEDKSLSQTALAYAIKENTAEPDLVKEFVKAKQLLKEGKPKTAVAEELGAYAGIRACGLVELAKAYPQLDIPELIKTKKPSVPKLQKFLANYRQENQKERLGKTPRYPSEQNVLTLFN